MGWARGHIGAVWVVLYKYGWLLGGPYLPSTGTENTHSGGEIARRGEMREPTAPLGVAVPSQAPWLTCPPPTAHGESRFGVGVARIAAVAIRQSSRSGLLCGVVAEPHKRQAQQRAHSRCSGHGAHRMRGGRAVSKAGLCRRQQAGRMGQRRTSKAPRSDKKQKTCGAKRPRVYVCAYEGVGQSNKHQPGAVGAVGDGALEPRGQLPPVLGGQNSRPNGSHGTSRTRERST